MKKIFESIRTTALVLLMLACFAYHANSQAKDNREFYEIRIYHLKDHQQEKQVDAFLEQALLPGLHRAGIPKLGVFKPVTNDTASDIQVYVLIPLPSLQHIVRLQEQLLKDRDYLSKGKDYLTASHDQPAYVRMESIILRAFPLAPKWNKPALSGPAADRIYELRSYESATEALHLNKVQMFNAGGEIALFKKLDFNAVFYAQVLSGHRMPNLMYMTSFNNMESREAHWKAFGDDPIWKKLSSMPEYQNNVSKIDIVFMHPASYSDF